MTSVQSSVLVLDDEGLEDRSLSFLEDDAGFLDDLEDIFLDGVSRSVSDPDCRVAALDFSRFLPLSFCLEDEVDDVDAFLLWRRAVGVGGCSSSASASKSSWSWT